jgi:hypothetical protein
VLDVYSRFNSQLLITPDCRLEEEIARMKKNQERRLHRKNAKLVKEGGTPMQVNRPVKADTTVSIPNLDYMMTADNCESQRRCGHCGQVGHMSACFLFSLTEFRSYHSLRNESEMP